MNKLVWAPVYFIATHGVSKCSTLDNLITEMLANQISEPIASARKVLSFFSIFRKNGDGKSVVGVREFNEVDNSDKYPLQDLIFLPESRDHNWFSRTVT